MSNATNANAWTSRLITGLFTAAAAWGSVTVEIRRTVNTRAEITEQRMEQVITAHLDAATRYLAAHQSTMLDTLTNMVQRIPHVQSKEATAILVPAPIDTLSEARQLEILHRLDNTDRRMRYIAIALAKLAVTPTPRPKGSSREPNKGSN